MPRFLHNADWQIGRQYSQFPADDAAPLAEAGSAAVETIARLAVEHKVDAVLGKLEDIGEDLAPDLLTRIGRKGAESGPVGELSFGAREQMGVISCLAYADLLKETGRPTLIILDDALVQSEECSA